MRTHLPKLMLLGLGTGIAALMFGKRQARPANPEVGPTDDELAAIDLDALDVSSVDAQSRLDLESDPESMDETLDAVEAASGDLNEIAVGDTGDLYGGHTPRALDREHPDDDHAMEDGQNWLEALETSAVENGPLPEKELDAIVDDDEIYAAPHSSDTSDTPVADRRSGGPGGM